MQLSRTLITSFFIALSSLTWSQDITIPDVNFKNALLQNPAVNLNQDGEIQLAEAQGYSGELLLDDLNILDLTGIENFINLSALSCNNNFLTDLNVSSFGLLTSLSCVNNQISNLDLSGNPLLTGLFCANNNLNFLSVAENPELITLSCGNNSILVLDLEGPNGPQANLRSLFCNGNDLLSLDLSSFSSLERVYCNDNPSLVELNIRNGNNTNFFWLLS